MFPAPPPPQQTAGVPLRNHASFFFPGGCVSPSTSWREYASGVRLLAPFRGSSIIGCVTRCRTEEMRSGARTQRQLGRGVGNEVILVVPSWAFCRCFHVTVSRGPELCASVLTTATCRPGRTYGSFAMGRDLLVGLDGPSLWWQAFRSTQRPCLRSASTRAPPVAALGRIGRVGQAMGCLVHLQSADFRRNGWLECGSPCPSATRLYLCELTLRPFLIALLHP